MNFNDPIDLREYKSRMLSILAPVVPANDKTKIPEDFDFIACRTVAGREIREYYLVYFLLVDLLGFGDRGQFEKRAWSVPIDYNGEAFLIEHRKMGIGVFASPGKEKEAEEITKRINNAIDFGASYFEYRAGSAAKGSNLNVRNNSVDLFERFNFFLLKYEAIREKIAH